MKGPDDFRNRNRVSRWCWCCYCCCCCCYRCCCSFMFFLPIHSCPFFSFAIRSDRSHHL